MRRSVYPLLAAALMVVACDKPASDTQPPTPEKQATGPEEGATADAEAKEAKEGEAAEEGKEASKEEKAPKDSFTAATFNLGWAHDDLADGPKKSKENGAQKQEDWKWKVKQIAKVLIESKPDIVALHELGGSLEVTEIVTAVREAGGPEYDWAYKDSDDPRNGHNSAILSRFPVSEERRFDIHLRRHVVSEVELPTGDKVTVIAIHPPEGTRKRAVKARRNQIDALEREIRQLRDDRPVIVLATMGSNIVPADETYDKSAAGQVAGANTNKEDDEAKVGLVLETTTDGELADRVFSCDLKMRDAVAAGSRLIVREGVDPWDKPWSKVPVEKAPHRDISDHLMVMAEIELPKPPPKEKKGEEGKEDAKKAEK